MLYPVLLAALLAQAPDREVVLLENDVVRVSEIRVAPGVGEPAHSHRRGVTVALSDYDNQTITLPERKPGGGHTRFGEVKWAEPVTHEARNSGTTVQRVIRLELKHDQPPAPINLEAVAKVLFENAWVRAVELRGETTPRPAKIRAVVVDLASPGANGVRWIEAESLQVSTHAVRIELK